ncbi:hypothetical protein GCM10007116_07340 [Sulfodiicoccus acidiphilus]|uniref:Uncharacterized protein n=1 Tax=Sulfodiicoccus acidiphilus TaxID=1670455 RepID=A0A830H0K0_9CREN|nr:hypothetical protein GCM10007116_07340 [Sulfodiicoccus acidiphilus]
MISYAMGKHYPHRAGDFRNVSPNLCRDARGRSWRSSLSQDLGPGWGGFVVDVSENTKTNLTEDLNHKDVRHLMVKPQLPGELPSS